MINVHKNLKGVGASDGRAREGRLLLTVQVIKMVVMVFLTGYVACGIILFFFIPIENAFEDAANNFISIYQNVIIFFMALVVFFIIKNPRRTQIRMFTEALDDYYEDEESNMEAGPKERWEGKKDAQIALFFLKKMGFNLNRTLTNTPSGPSHTSVV